MMAELHENAMKSFRDAPFWWS